MFTNAVTEIVADANAIVDFYKIQNNTLNCSLIDNTWAKQAKRAIAPSIHLVLAESLLETI